MVDKRENPYHPGAGEPPRYLSGRDIYIDDFKSNIDYLNQGSYVKSWIFYGFRGVGKTSLMLKLLDIAIEQDLAVSEPVEIAEEENLRVSVTKVAESILEQLSKKEKIKKSLEKSPLRLSGFQMKFLGQGLSVDIEERAIRADLEALLEKIGKLCDENGTGALFILDEMQNLNKEELQAICISFQNIAKKRLPVFLVGSGLPSLKDNLVEATAYAPRLFQYHKLDRLLQEDTEKAILKPAENTELKWTKSILKKIFEDTQGHPYFVQEYGAVAWEQLDKWGVQINKENFETLRKETTQRLHRDFFETFFRQATDTEQDYLILMALENNKKIKTGDIAAKLKGASALRYSLIKKELIWSPRRGQIDFTIAGFSDFIRKEEYSVDQNSLKS